ncbi:putative ABC transporter ATP-binding protein [Sinosporangium siamense]|uniref:ABC transporter ATP-binding protein n=1 Tax=Sinosporangium siamense TaxID=1367973 RepID=A0A919VAS1_9ACTN|nr:ABC transporter ATP-binding protein [Sinosporangium siamense]GII91399.1 putative ABC transporter ATP-binding protein [Sinosporangium siamense]
MRLLWSLARPHWRTLALGLLLALLGSALELAAPMATKLVLDSLNGSLQLAWPVTILLGLLVLGALIAVWQGFLLGGLAERVILGARESLVRRYLRIELLPLTQRPAGELITRVTSDTVLLREAVTSSVIGLVNGTVLLIGILVLMGTLDLVLLGICTGAVVVVGAAFMTLMPAIAKAYEKAQESLGHMGGLLEGALRALRTVKASRAEEPIGDRILAGARTAAAHGVRAVRRETVAWVVVYSGIQLAVIAVLAVGAWRVSAGLLEVSSLIAFLLYAFALMGPIEELSRQASALQSGVAAAARIREVEALPLEAGHGGDVPGAGVRAPAVRHRPGVRARVVLPQDPERPVAELRAVTARYAPDAEPAVRGVDLAVPRRGHMALVGPSGAGKTTVFSLLLRFLHPESGQLLVDGVPYDELAPPDIRAHFAYVEQDAPVIPGSIRDNLLISHPEATAEDMWRVLGDVRLARHIEELSEGLDTPLTSTSLSGGQRQRIALARALLHAPGILLLDEATAQVDAVTEAAIGECVRRHAERSAVVTIAHRLSTVVHADRIVVMDAGRVRAAGTHGELLRADALYRELVTALHIADAPAEPVEARAD